METSVGQIIEMVERLKKKEVKALEEAKNRKLNSSISIFYGARIGMLNEVLEDIENLKKINAMF